MSRVILLAALASSVTWENPGIVWGPGCYPVCGPDGSDQGAICCSMDRGGQSFDACKAEMLRTCPRDKDPGHICDEAKGLEPAPCKKLPNA